MSSRLASLYPSAAAQERWRREKLEEYQPLVPPLNSRLLATLPLSQPPLSRLTGKVAAVASSSLRSLYIDRSTFGHG